MLNTSNVKLQTSAEQKDGLLRTMEAFSRACNHISRVAWGKMVFGKWALQKAPYREIRENFGLSAQLTIRAIGKVADSYKVDKKSLHQFRQDSAVVYDQRVLSFKSANHVSMLTLQGGITVPFLFRPDISLDITKVRGQADLLYRKGQFFLCFAVEVAEAIPIEPQGALGVDLGIVNLATTSEGRAFSGETVDAVRERITTLKRGLQRKGSKSAKRHLKKLSGREARFKRNTSHVISKEIVRTAEGTCSAIVLEDLKGFKCRTTVNRAARDRFGKWAFGQLRQFIEYKARRVGVPVVFVYPRNTSRTCSVYGHVLKSSRKSQSLFSCVNCGTTMNADLNGAINIAQRAPVNAPIAVHVPALPSPVLGTASPVL